MSRNKKVTLEVQGTVMVVLKQNDQDYISLTDIARYRNLREPFAVINNWMRSRSTIEFLGLWEKLSNQGFKPLEFERFKSESGSNYFVLSPQQWIDKTKAVGLVSIGAVPGRAAEAPESDRYPADADTRRAYGGASARASEGEKGMSVEHFNREGRDEPRNH